MGDGLIVDIVADGGPSSRIAFFVRTRSGAGTRDDL